MLFSIIIPVYNVEKYLPECLKAIEDQTISDYEVIIVDDGSTDHSGKICDQYQEKHNNTIVIHKKNQGLLLARRTGLREAKGEYILHCDSDDYLEVTALEEIREIINRNHPDMVMYGYNLVDNNHQIMEECYHVFPDLFEINSSNREKLLAMFSSTVWLNSMFTKATRRELYDIDTDYSSYGNIKIGEDVLQVIPLIEKCRTFVFHEKPLVNYRYNPNGLSKQLTTEYLDNYLLISEKVEGLLHNEKVQEATMIMFYNRYIKDVYKYLLKYLKAGISKSDFIRKHDQVKRHKIYKHAGEYCDKWDATNKFLSVLVNPKNAFVCSMLSRSVLANRLR